jgi:adenylate cyclase class 2
MPIEVEQKFRVADHMALEQRLMTAGAVRGETVEQVDRYLSHPARDFGRTDEALRLRLVGPRNYITYKGPKLDATTKTRHEIEIELQAGQKSAAGALELFAALGFTAVTDVCKHRIHFTVTWQDREIGIALDNVAELGNFVELEIVTEASDAAAARACIASLALELGLTDNERRSYLELLLAQRKSATGK